VGPLHHAVAVDIGVDDGGGRPGGAAAGQFDRGGARLAEPALGGDPAAAGVDAQRHPAGGPVAHALAPVGVLQRAGAEDHAIGPPAERLLDVLLGADAAAQLAGDAGGGDDAADAVAVDRSALAGAVEIDEVEVPSALLDPAPGGAGGVAVEDGLPRVVA